MSERPAPPSPVTAPMAMPDHQLIRPHRRPLRRLMRLILRRARS